MDHLGRQRAVDGSRRLGAFARTLALALIAGTLLPGAAQASSTLGIGGFAARPATFNAADPVTRAYFKLSLAPGTVRREAAIVSNPGAMPVTVRVYPVDGLTGQTSGAVYGNRGTPLHAAGLWLTPAVTELTIAPGSARRVPFLVRIPSSAQPGDHLAGVAFEGANPSRTSGHFSIITVFRVVIGVDIRVPGPAAPRIALTGETIRALPGTQAPSVVLDLANRGGLLCHPVVAVTLRGQGVHRTAVQHLDTILPADAIAYPFHWPGALADGRYTVLARATACGPAAAISGSASVGSPLSPHVPGTPLLPMAPQPPAVTQWWLLAATALGGLLAGVLGFALTIVLRRRRRRHGAAPVPQPVESG